MDNLCVMCGASIPDGRQVCPICEADIDDRLSCGLLEEDT